MRILILIMKTGVQTSVELKKDGLVRDYLLFVVRFVEME